MRSIKFIGIGALLLTCVAFAEPAGTLDDAAPSEKVFQEIRTLKNEGRLLQARDVAIKYVQKYPHDLDLKVLLAAIYDELDDFRSATELLKAVLAKSPHETDALELMQKVEADEAAFKQQAAQLDHAETNVLTLQTKEDYIATVQRQLVAENYKAALTTAKAGLKQYPNDPDLLQAENKAYYGLGEFHGPGPSFYTASTFTPQNLQATEVLNAIVSETGKEYGKSQFGFNQQSIIATSPDGYWDFTNLYYTHDTDFGTMISSLNYARRFGYTGFQFAMEAITNVNKYIYFDLNAAYADNLNLFPNWTFGAEGYFSIPHFIDISAGNLYRNINPTYFNTYTMSFSKDVGDFWLSFRPYAFVPKTGTSSVYYTLTTRRYLGTVDHFVSMTLGYGVTPDLASLETVDFITVDDKAISLTYQRPLDNHRWIINVGASYENQIFPSGMVRQLTGVDVGLRVRF